MRERARRATLLALVLGLGLLSHLPSAQAHPFHLHVENPTVVSPEGVNLDRWVAQSFVPTSAFFLSRVSLYVADTGTSDILSVSMRPDATGFPATLNLSQGSGDGVPGPGAWLDIDMSPVIEVVANQTLWIVAHSERPAGSAYDWWNSGDDLAYPSGTAAISSDGLVWSGAGKDYSFRVYGFQQPNITFSVTGSPSTMRPGESVVFQPRFTNLGPGTAMAAWVNVTLPSMLTYVTDDAASIGGVRSGTYSFAFANIALGGYIFNLTATANGGAPNGTVATTPFTFEATDHNGAPFVQVTRSVAITIMNARVAISTTSSPSALDPGDTFVTDSTVTNVGMDSAGDVVVEGIVGPLAAYVSSAPSGTYNPVTRTIQWSISSLSPGVAINLAWTTQVAVGTPDRTWIASLVRLTYRDSTGTLFAPETASTNVSVAAPQFTTALSLDQSTAERGDEVVATFTHDNSGSVPAPLAWANWSVGSRYQLLALQPALPYTATVDGFSITFANVAPGPHSLVARLRVIQGLADGLVMGIDVRWAATDGNGNLLPDATHSRAVELRAPTVELDLRSATRAEAGSTLTLELVLRNVGRAAAMGWLNLSLPADVTYIGDNGTAPPTTADGRVVWVLTSLPAGTSTTLGVVLRIEGPTRVASFRFVLNLTDGRGSATVPLFSNPTSVELVAPEPQTPGPEMWWVGLTAIVVAGATLLLFTFTRRRSSDVKIENVFVVDTRGMLLAHRSGSLVPYPDQDIMAGMFTAVQDYIRDAWGGGEEKTMKSAQFGDRKVVVERGRHHYVAVVFSGNDRGALERRVRELSQEIDSRFGDVIANWDGQEKNVHEIDLLLPQIWTPRTRHRVASN